MASGDLPFIKLDPREFLSHGRVGGLSAEALGVYTRLSLLSWYERPPCTIPDDDSDIAGRIPGGVDVWPRVCAAVRACFVARDGRLENEWLLAKYNEVRRHQAAAAANGKNGAAKRWGGNGHPIATPKPPHSKEEYREQREDKDQCKKVSEARAREAGGDGAKPQPTIVERVAARIGHDIGSEGINLIRGEDRYVARGDVLIHGQPVPAIDLFDRCVIAALAEPGFVYKHATAFLNYVGVIFNRCERDQVWPEEHAPRQDATNRVTLSANAQAERLRKRRENRA